MTCRTLSHGCFRRASGFNRARQQRGSIFAMIFGAVALVGVLAAVGMQTISGPVTTITRVTQRNVADTQLLMSAKIIINAAVTGTAGGDADADGIIEPAPFVAAAAGETPPANGGYLPTSLGLSLTDPWGTKYGYCVWDHGTVNSSTGRIDGDSNATASQQPVIAIIAAGPDKTFQMGCPTYSGSVMSVDRQGDDLVFKYTYAEASANSNGLWTLNTSDQSKAELKDSSGSAVNVSINRNTGIGDFLGVTTDTLAAKTANITLDGGLKFDTEANVTSCGAAQAGTVRFNAAATVLEVCDGAGNWKPTGSDIWKLEGSNVHLKDNAYNVGIGTNAPSQKLDVTGNANISGNITVGGTGNITGDFTVNTDAFNVDATNKRVAIGKAVPNVALDVNGDSYVLGNGTYTGSLTVDTSTLYVDASDNRVGIGTTTPIEALNVEGNIAAKSLYLADDSAANKKSRFYMAGGGQIDLSLNGTAVFSADASDFTLSKNLILSGPRQIRLNGAGTTGALNINSWGIPHIVLERDDSNFIEGWNSGRTVQKFAIHGSGGATFGSGVKIGADAVCNASKTGMLAWNASQLQVCDGSAFFNVRSIASLDDIGDVYLSETGNPEPNNNEVLAWNAADNRWEAKNINTVGSAIATPGGVDKQVQFNDNGTLAGASQLYWDKANSRLGIGTTSPDRILHLANNSPELILEELDQAADQKKWRIWSNNGKLSFQSLTDAITGSSLPVMEIMRGGVVTISGTPSINGANRALLALTDRTDLAADIGGGLHFGGIYTAGGATAEWAGIKGGKANATSGDYGGYLAFMTRSNGSATAERMRIDSAGNVGIGTTAPVSKLDVAGGARVGPDATCNASKAGMLAWNSNTLQVCTDAGTFTNIASASGGASQWSNGASGAIYYNGGNVGIGTTNPTSKLEVAGGVKLSAGSSLTWPSNPGGGAYDVAYIKYSVESGENTQLEIANFNDADDDIIFKSGAFSFMPAQIGSGNVGIGTVTPATLLHVAGGIQLANDTASCPGASNVKIGTLKFVSDTLSICTTGGWASLVEAGGSVTPGGTDKQVQFNDGGTLAGAAQLYWDKANDRLGIGTANLTDAATDAPIDVVTDATGRKGIKISRNGGGTGHLNLYATASSTAPIGNVIEAISADLSLYTLYRQFFTAGGGGWSNAYVFNTANPMSYSGGGTFIHAPVTYAATSGTGNFYGLDLAPTINQSGSAAQNYTALRINVTESSFLGGDGRIFDAQKNGSSLLVVKNTGNVGIGTTSPSQKLEVSGNIRLTGPDFNIYSSTRCKSDGEGGSDPLGYCDGAGRALVHYPGDILNLNYTNDYDGGVLIGTSSMFLPNGNVGIGTTSPTHGLMILHSSWDQLRLEAPGNYSAIRFGADTGSNKDLLIHYGGNGTPQNTLRFGRMADNNGVWEANPVVFDMDAPDGTLWVHENGNVGIGTTSPAVKLDANGAVRVGSDFMIKGGATEGGQISLGYPNNPSFTGEGASMWVMDVYSNNALRIFRRDASNASLNVMNILENGNVGIGTSSPSYALHIASGQVAGAGAYVNTSDARLKTKIADLDYGLETVMRLRPVSFHWKEQKDDWQRGRKLGLIAQETEALIPEVVTTAKDLIGTKSIAYGDLTPVLIRAVQELKAANDNEKASRELDIWKHNREIEALKAANDNLRAELRTLQEEINTMRRAQQ